MAIPAITPMLIPEVAVACAPVAADHPTLEIAAVCGESQITSRLTLGCIDTPNANYDLAAAQADLDTFKQKISDQAAFKERMRLIAQQLK